MSVYRSLMCISLASHSLERIRGFCETSENILYNPESGPEHLVKLIDFGLCTKAVSSPDHMLHDFCGSPGFFAPEILLHECYDGMKADVWSLGCILLEVRALLLSQRGSVRLLPFCLCEKLTPCLFPVGHWKHHVCHALDGYVRAGHLERPETIRGVRQSGQYLLCFFATVTPTFLSPAVAQRLIDLALSYLPGHSTHPRALPQLQMGAFHETAAFADGDAV